MKKVFSKVVTVLLLIAVMCGVVVMFAGCDKEPKYEIKLYDDNWNELEKQGDGYKWGYEFKYDGTSKGFNAKAFKDGEEIYEFNYKTDEYTYHKDLVIAVGIYYHATGAGDLIVDGIYTFLPIEKGEYTISYMFYTMKANSDYMPKYEDAPDTYSHRIKFKIV